MTVLLAILTVAAVVFVTGTVRAIRRQRRERLHLAEKAKLRRAVYDARVVIEQTHANRRND